MPPARRGRPPGSTSSNSTSNNPRGAQSTLAFGRSNKITKPSIPAPASKKAVKPHAQQGQHEQRVKEITHLVVDGEEERSAHEEEEKEEEEVVNGRREAAATRQGGGEDEDEEAEGKARKVSEAAVKRYWRAKEGERKAPRGVYYCVGFGFFFPYLMISYPLPFPSVFWGGFTCPFSFSFSFSTSNSNVPLAFIYFFGKKPG